MIQSITRDKKSRSGMRTMTAKEEIDFAIILINCAIYPKLKPYDKKTELGECVRFLIKSWPVPKVK